MQHDTSPHEVEVGGRRYKAQTASAVLCYSRMLFFQINPTFQRFDCKVFLTDAVRYTNGALERVMIYNTHTAGAARHGARDDSRFPRWKRSPAPPRVPLQWRMRLVTPTGRRA